MGSCARAGSADARIEQELRFDESLNWEEDYEFLLRVCAHSKADFSAVGTFIGWYNFKTDGSNSIPTTLQAAFDRREAQERTRAEIARHKQGIVLAPEIAAAVRAATTLGGEGKLTAADVATAKKASSSSGIAPPLTTRGLAHMRRHGLWKTAGKVWHRWHGSRLSNSSDPECLEVDDRGTAM